MDLRSVKRAIALESDRLKKRRRRSISCLDLSAWCMKTAVCIAILLQYDLDCGAPVPSCELIRCYNGQVVEHELAPLSPLVSPVVRPMGKSWCSEWRQRHGARIVFFRATEPMGLEEKREQA